MYNYFVKRGMRAFLREWVAAALAVTVGSIIFGLLCSKYSASDEGAGLVAATVTSLPLAIVILFGVRSKNVGFRKATVPAQRRRRPPAVVRLSVADAEAIRARARTKASP